MHLRIRRLLQAVSGPCHRTRASRRLPRLRFWPRLLSLRDLRMRLLRGQGPPCLAGRCAAVPFPRLPARVGSALGLGTRSGQRVARYLSSRRVGVCAGDNGVVVPLLASLRLLAGAFYAAEFLARLMLKTAMCK